MTNPEESAQQSESEITPEELIFHMELENTRWDNQMTDKKSHQESRV